MINPSMASPAPIDLTPPGGLKLHAAAQYLGLSEVTVRRLVAKGKLRPVRDVRHLLFSRKNLDAVLAGE